MTTRKPFHRKDLKVDAATAAGFKMYFSLKRPAVVAKDRVVAQLGAR